MKKTLGQKETGPELVFGRNGTDKSAHMRTGLLQEQELVCANHSNEEIALEQTGWQEFSCPKCGCDYSIGRKIAVVQ